MTSTSDLSTPGKNLVDVILADAARAEAHLVVLCSSQAHDPLIEFTTKRPIAFSGSTRLNKFRWVDIRDACEYLPAFMSLPIPIRRMNLNRHKLLGR